MHVLCLPIGICGDWQPHLIGAQPLNRQKRAFGHQIVAWVARNLLKIRSNLRKYKNLFSPFLNNKSRKIEDLSNRFSIWRVRKKLKFIELNSWLFVLKHAAFPPDLRLLGAKLIPVKWTTNDWPVILKMVFTHSVQISLQDLM